MPRQRKNGITRPHYNAPSGIRKPDTFFDWVCAQAKAGITFQNEAQARAAYEADIQATAYEVAP